jgi:uncharacterized protein YneF (UPF0154 family)
MWKALVIVVAVFPWSLVVGLVVGAFIRRHRHQPHAYLPPSAAEPILDSAQIAKVLRETRQ